MKTVFTKQYGLSNRGCFARDQMTQIFGDKDEITLDEVLSLPIEFKDKAYFVTNKCELTDLQVQVMSLNMVNSIIPLFEKVFPENNYPKMIIEKCKNFLDGKISKDNFLSFDFDIDKAGTSTSIDDLRGETYICAHYVLSSACSLYRCLCDPLSYRSDSIYDAIDAVDHTNLRAHQDLYELFTLLIDSIINSKY